MNDGTGTSTQEQGAQVLELASGDRKKRRERTVAASGAAQAATGEPIDMSAQSTSIGSQAEPPRAICSLETIGRLQESRIQQKWASYDYMTSSPLSEVLRPGYWNKAVSYLKRHDRIHVTCTRNVYGDPFEPNGDALGPADYAILIVTRCEKAGDGHDDVAVISLRTAQSHPDEGPKNLNLATRSKQPA